jgi:hypothetical protein
VPGLLANVATPISDEPTHPSRPDIPKASQTFLMRPFTHDCFRKRIDPGTNWNIAFDNLAAKPFYKK